MIRRAAGDVGDDLAVAEPVALDENVGTEVRELRRDRDRVVLRVGNEVIGNQDPVNDQDPRRRLDGDRVRGPDRIGVGVERPDDGQAPLGVAIVSERNGRGIRLLVECADASDGKAEIGAPLIGEEEGIRAGEPTHL